MTAEQRPAAVAFDGSPESEAAVRAAAELFPGRRLAVISVWEPGLAYAAVSPGYDPTIMGGYPMPTVEEVALLDEVQHDRAAETAEAGARIARELGADAVAHPAEDRGQISDTIAAVAEELDACAVVVGTRGRGAVKAKLLGSTSAALLHRAPCPVVVVRPQPSR
jgi:nucleotide-binding universal stress UspA family protein